MHITLYDACMVSLIIISTIGIVWSGFAMSRHSREIRVYKQVRVEFPFNKWPKVLEPKNLPPWIQRVAAYFLPIPKKEG